MYIQFLRTAPRIVPARLPEGHELLSLARRWFDELSGCYRAVKRDIPRVSRRTESRPSEEIVQALGIGSQVFVALHVEDLVKVVRKAEKIHDRIHQVAFARR